MKLSPRTPSRRRFHHGFTLLEMVFVLGIIAMILGGAIYKMKAIADSTKITQADGDFKSIANAIEIYKMNGGTYPTSQQGLKALVVKPSTNPVPRRWQASMDEVPNDPWGREYIYRFPGKKDANSYEIISYGKDGVENTDDDLSSQD